MYAYLNGTIPCWPASTTDNPSCNSAPLNTVNQLCATLQGTLAVMSQASSASNGGFIKRLLPHTQAEQRCTPTAAHGEPAHTCSYLQRSLFFQFDVKRGINLLIKYLKQKVFTNFNRKSMSSGDHKHLPLAKEKYTYRKTATFVKEKKLHGITLAFHLKKKKTSIYRTLLKYVHLWKQKRL